MIPPIQLKMVKALIGAEHPLTLTEIATEVSEPKQKVSYHLPILISQGVVLPVGDTTYAAQDLFASEDVATLMEPIIYFIIHNIDAESSDNMESTVMHFLSFFFAVQEWNSDEE